MDVFSSVWQYFDMYFNDMRIVSMNLGTSSQLRTLSTPNVRDKRLDKTAR